MPRNHHRLASGSVSSLSSIDLKICRSSPPGKSVRPMLSRNKVSPAINLCSLGNPTAKCSPACAPAYAAREKSCSHSASVSPSLPPPYRSPSSPGVFIPGATMLARPSWSYNSPSLAFICTGAPRRRLQLRRPADMIDMRMGNARSPFTPSDDAWRAPAVSDRCCPPDLITIASRRLLVAKN